RGKADAQVTSAEQLWIVCSEALRTHVTEAAWKTWFDGVQPLVAEHGRLELAVPSMLVKERIESRYLPLVRDALADAAGEQVTVELRVVTPSNAGANGDDTDAGLLGGHDWTEKSAVPAQEVEPG